MTTKKYKFAVYDKVKVLCPDELQDKEGMVTKRLAPSLYEVSFLVNKQGVTRYFGPDELTKTGVVSRSERRR